VQITVNRKTTQIKSLTETLMSEKAFEIYTTTGTIYNYETSIGKFTPFKIEDENRLIEESICFMEKMLGKTYNLSKKRVRNNLDKMLSNAMECFIYAAWTIDTFGSNEMDWFLSAFNRKTTMIENIKKLNEVLKINLENSLPDEFLKIWKTIELTKCANSREISFIEFVNKNYLQIIAERMKEKKTRDFCLITEKENLSINEVDKVISSLIKRYINYSIDFY
jgi:hypothetical protein